MKIFWVLLMLGLVAITTSVRSDEALARWHWRNPQPQGNLLHNVSFVNGQYLAVGEMGTILTSADATNWVVQNSGTTMELRDCVYGAGKYVVVGDYGTVLTSPDAITWTPQYAGTFYSLNGVTFANGQFVCVGEQATIMTSADGVWWAIESSGPWTLRDIVFAEGLYVAVGGNVANANTVGVKVLLTSTNAQAWRIQLLENDAPFFSVAYGNGEFAATSVDTFWTGMGELWRSANGLNWGPSSSATLPLPEPVLSYANGKWILIGRNPNIADPGEIHVSDDLMNWNAVFTNDVSLAAVCFGSAGYVAAQVNGSFLLSSNAINWASHFSDLGISYLSDLAYLNEQFVGLNFQKLIFSSNGTTWTTMPAPTNTGTLFNIAFGEGIYVVGGEARSVWVSSNLVEWWNPISNLTSEPYVANTKVTYGNGCFVGVASYEGSVLTSGDGWNWTLQQLSTNEFDYLDFTDVTFGSGRFVAVSPTATATSLDGTNWLTMRTNLLVSSVCSGAGKFVAVGGNTIATSTNGVDWAVYRTENQVPLVDVAYGAGYFVVTSGRYYSNPNQIKTPQPYWVSADGVNWSKRHFSTPQGVGPIAFGDGTFVAAAARGGLLQSDPLIVLNLQLSPQPQIHISGPRHRQYRVESRGLHSATNVWDNRGTVTAAHGVAVFTEPEAGSPEGRYYRVLLLP